MLLGLCACHENMLDVGASVLAARLLLFEVPHTDIATPIEAAAAAAGAE